MLVLIPGRVEDMIMHRCAPPVNRTRDRIRSDTFVLDEHKDLRRSIWLVGAFVLGLLP